LEWAWLRALLWPPLPLLLPPRGRARDPRRRHHRRTPCSRCRCPSRGSARGRRFLLRCCAGARSPFSGAGAATAAAEAALAAVLAEAQAACAHSLLMSAPPLAVPSFSAATPRRAFFLGRHRRVDRRRRRWAHRALSSARGNRCPTSSARGRRLYLWLGHRLARRRDKRSSTVSRGPPA
jgi:hypothetical protein